MGTAKEANVRWEPRDPRLLRAARRLIRLYDLQQSQLFAVNAESLADVISQELNRDPDEPGGGKQR